MHPPSLNPYEAPSERALNEGADVGVLSLRQILAVFFFINVGTLFLHGLLWFSAVLFEAFRPTYYKSHLGTIFLLGEPGESILGHVIFVVPFWGTTINTALINGGAVFGYFVWRRIDQPSAWRGACWGAVVTTLILAGSALCLTLAYRSPFSG